MDLRITVNDLATARFLQDCVLDQLDAHGRAAWENIRHAKDLDAAHAYQQQHDHLCDRCGVILKRLGDIVGHLEQRAASDAAERAGVLKLEL